MPTDLKFLETKVIFTWRDKLVSSQRIFRYFFTILFHISFFFSNNSFSIWFKSCEYVMISFAYGNNLNKQKKYPFQILLIFLKLWRSWAKVTVDNSSNDCWMELEYFLKKFPSFTSEMIHCSISEHFGFFLN